MNLDPVKLLHHRLNNIEHWSTKYPTKHELIHTTPPPSPRRNTNPTNRLPFNADQWLDEPTLGAQGAKTWPEIWDNLASWLRAWKKELKNTPGNDWQRLHTLIDLLASHYENDFYELEETITTIHRRMHLTVNAPVYGKPCLTCNQPMHKTMTKHGWNGTYHCPTCKQTITHQTWQHNYQEKLKQSQTPLPANEIIELFGISRQLLQTWKTRGKIKPATKKNGKNYYKPIDIYQQL